MPAQHGMSESPELGNPHHLSFGVPDVATARDLVAKATGTRFTPVSTSTVSVRQAGEDQPRRVTLRRARSVRGSTVLELVEADPPVGPWAPTAASPALSYAVPDAGDAALTERLSSAGLRRIADGPGFAYWQGVGGGRVRLIEPDALPAAEQTDQPAPSLDLGPAASLTVSPEHAADVRTQLSAALGLRWAPPMAFPLLWSWASGGRRLMVATVVATYGVDPDATRVVMETPHHVPSTPDFACAPGETPMHLAFFTSNLAAAHQQLVDAGMRLVGRVPGLVSYFFGPGSIRIEIARSAFKAAVPVTDALGRLTERLRR